MIVYKYLEYLESSKKKRFYDYFKLCLGRLSQYDL